LPFSRFDGAAQRKPTGPDTVTTDDELDEAIAGADELDELTVVTVELDEAAAGADELDELTVAVDDDELLIT
jgi:hypothetical protein